MLTQHIALVPTAGGVDASELARVGAALQKQVTRDLAPLWGISATVDAFPELEDVPLGYWPILLSTGETSQDTGRFLDENAQPYAHVLLSPHWSVVASRACLELLLNPTGNRTLVCASPRYNQGLVQMLVEICAACEDPSHAYVVNDVLVSDFCTPAFFEVESAAAHDRFSFYGSIAAPLQLLIGGHLTWFDAASDSWWLRTQHDGEPVDSRLGPLAADVGSLRELVRRGAPPSRRTWTLTYEAFETRARLIREQASFAAHARARRLRSLLGQQSESDLGTFDGVTREFEQESANAPAARDAAARFAPAHDAERHESVSDDELSAPLELVTRQPAAAQPLASGAPSTAARITEGSVVASFVLPPPDAPQAESAGAKELLTTADALTPARPEEAHPAARERHAGAARSAAAEARVIAREPSKPPLPGSSIAPPALGLMEPARSNQGLDARILAGALVMAAVVVLAFTQRRAPSTPVVTRAVAASPALSAPAIDASAGPAAPAVEPPPVLANETQLGVTAAASAGAAPATAPDREPERAAHSRHDAASAKGRPPAKTPKAASIEALFETRR
jgi:hypothetical protein